MNRSATLSLVHISYPAQDERGAHDLARTIYGQSGALATPSDIKFQRLVWGNCGVPP